MEENFSFNSLSNIFKNVTHKVSNSPGFDFAFDIHQEATDKNPRQLVGELFYSKDFNELVFIKDNFPMPRQAFSITFPVKTKEMLVELFKSININLI